MNLQSAGSRRRGEELEQAILAAAWEQLLEAGYPNFTIDAVAQRAGTSRSVLYRRWPDRDALTEATIGYGFRLDRPAPTDTGTLRGDAIELLRAASRSRAPLVPMMSVLMGSHFSRTGESFADLRERLLGDVSARGPMDEIINRAVQRGEVDRTRITPRARTIAFDLVRHDLLMTLRPVSDEQILAIVDQVFLPLVGVEPSPTSQPSRASTEPDGQRP